MELSVRGITEEEYGVWLNGGDIVNIESIKYHEALICNIGFELENIKNFIVDLNCLKHTVFLKVHNDRTYDLYREHLITIIKMMILNRKHYNIKIYIVSDKNEDYKNELNNFLNMSTRYQRGNSYRQLIALIKCASMRYVGFKITQRITNINQRIITLLKMIRR